MTITTPPPEVPRDRWKRPLITPEKGGKAKPYTRCTTFIDCIDDKYNLQQWEKRMVATGLSMRPGLMLSVAAHLDDKDKLNDLCDEAKEAAAASEKATIGTALHALTEQMDRGQPVGVVPEPYMTDLAAYAAATKDFVATHIEQLMVLDTLQIAGTPDRVVKFQGKRYIADVKTGSIEYGSLKMAMQLAVYARSHTYDWQTNTRGVHDADTQRGIIIHLPAGEGVCTLYWIDLVAGWEGVKLARQVRDIRKSKLADLCQPVGTEPLLAMLPEAAAEPDLTTLIKRAASLDTLTALWVQHEAVWTDDHTTLAKDQRAAIEKDAELDSLAKTG